MSAATEAIARAREAMNDAIARRDAAAVGAFLLPEYHVVTARSVHRSGRDASIASWAEMFDRDPLATYRRTPDQIQVNDEAGMAQEHGRWTGRMTTAEGVIELSGVYAAKWRAAGGAWKLEAEIFTPLVRPVTTPELKIEN